MHSGQVELARSLADDEVVHCKDRGDSEADVGLILSRIGEYDRAMDWYERAFDNRTFLFDFYQGASVPAEFFRTRRWAELTQRPEFKAWQAARQRATTLWGDTKS